MPVAAMPENLGPRLTLDELRATVDEIRRVRSDQYADYTGRALALSGAVTRHFLGREWTQKHADPTSRHAGFFKIDTSPTIQGQLSAFRIYDLGEVLFNLQHIDGFDDRLSDMQIPRKIEPTVAELDVARLLFLHKYMFRFIPPKQLAKGENYDFDIALPDGTEICADAKCKIETTDFSPNTVINSLKDGVKQLPDDRPGMIFVKVPQRWIATLPMAIAMAQTAEGWLGRHDQNTRIVSVKFYVSHLTFESGGVVHRHAYKEVSNRNNKFSSDRDWDMFEDHPVPASWNGLPPWWTRFYKFPEGS